MIKLVVYFSIDLCIMGVIGNRDAAATYGLVLTLTALCPDRAVIFLS